MNQNLNLAFLKGKLKLKLDLEKFLVVFPEVFGHFCNKIQTDKKAVLTNIIKA